jgi:hypothetical protein
MTGPEQRHIPDWAQAERGADLTWISENLHVLWPLARQAYDEIGRGAVVVDTTLSLAGFGHPFGYFPREMVEEYGNKDTLRMVLEYNPSWEMVTVLLKTENRSSSYRVGVLPPQSTARRGSNGQ